MPARAQSRITTACNACRTRKQKCSGNRPKCIQCLEHRRNCDWPEQLKRGPAKGYIESLERRLHETESLLLGLLEQVSDSQLAEGIPSPQSQSSPDPNPTGQVRSASASGAVSSTKRGSEHWELYPLNSVQGIRAWQEECTRQGPGPGSGPARERASVSALTRTSTPRVDRHHAAVGQSTTSANVVDPPSMSVSTSMQDSAAQIPQPTQRLRKSPEPQPSVSAWSGAPSANFQQRFLW
ncbi:Zn(II)2Cys6 transcription factor domain-containing protein [Aspergillus undulatus]|uniref:Zn(II)2Cys6 transcription factor domain-containing protein n=1 Tax=Aspergillus undulatus TaxID=1810928 RepID=UPI003CCE27EB